MQKVKISAVSYLNTLPFVYGLKHSGFLNSQIELSLDMPSACAEKLISRKADIGLVPVAVIPRLQAPEIISDFCIGAEGTVRTVLLVSDVPLNQIQTVLLDYQSRTSVKLVQVLAKYFWKIAPRFEHAQPGYESQIRGKRAGVIIGDRTFHLPRAFAQIFDLAEEWQKFTALPFVFAAWVANKPLAESFKNRFNAATRFGIKHITDVVNEYKKNGGLNGVDLQAYFQENISYSLDEKKKLALKYFLELCQSLE